MHPPLFLSKLLQSSSDQLSTGSPYRLDEGFSEDVRSDGGTPAPDSLDVNLSDELSEQVASARQWLLSQPADLRAEIVCDLLNSLPNSIVSDIVREANNRLYFDPVLCLPSEIVLQIFGELDTSTLLNASLVSKSWRSITFQPPFWRRLFRLAGWTHHRENLRSFEANSRVQIAKIWSNPRIRPRPSDFGSDAANVKRLRGSDPVPNTAHNQRLWVEQSSLGVPPEWTEADADMDRDGAGGHGGVLLGNTGRIHNERENSTFWPPPRDDTASDANSGARISDQAVCPLLNPSRLVDTISEPPRLNWHWLYKQRHRLEQNWDAGRFTNFRLPHPDFPSEGHTECVYTLQFSQRYLVSGSRDRSVRVWDLDTKRLKLPPLLGHRGSVLCLQFDESPSRDLIISGSSDSDVIIWKFSTGAIIKKLQRAHRESVLNLQFDDRYLATCSKDHTIKLWNMRALLPTDPEYPGTIRARDATFPDYILDATQMMNDPKMRPVDPLPRFSHLMTFRGHGAAVNAIQMYEDFIVSASGDRKIMLWNIRDGSRVRVFTGHTKGIACVQYDGRRIVSGSSDNTVRIFDSATGAEVALLNNHRHLVRTVQAEFGDTIESEDTLESEARNNDQIVLDARARAGKGPGANLPSQRHFVFGAKLPPGGGGNRWSKIVSGSYDQTVLIWRRDKEGSWRIKRELRHEEALRRSADPSGRLRDWDGSSVPASHVAGRASFSLGSLLQQHSRVRLQRQHVDRLPQTVIRAASTSPDPTGTLQAPQASGRAASLPITETIGRGLAVPTIAPMRDIGSGQPDSNEPPLLINQAQTQAHMPIHHNGPIHHHLPQAPQITQPRGVLPARRIALDTAAAAPTADRDANRVFKLQFDARRIICSSSMPTIVGWDFANGDRDIEEASQFFGEPA